MPPGLLRPVGGGDVQIGAQGTPPRTGVVRDRGAPEASDYLRAQEDKQEELSSLLLLA